MRQETGVSRKAKGERTKMKIGYKDNLVFFSPDSCLLSTDNFLLSGVPL
jgi:hypothetical protein